MFLSETAFKYLFTRGKGQRHNTILIILGIALSLMAVIVVSSIVNGLQDNQTYLLRDVESFDLIVEDTTLSSRAINEMENVDFSFDFLETAVLINDRNTGKGVISRVRALDRDLFSNTRFSETVSFSMSDNAFEEGLIISYSMLSSLDYSNGDEILLTVLQKGKSGALAPKNISTQDIGVFGSRVQSFNDSTALMNLEFAEQILKTDQKKIGVYTSNPAKVLKQIHKADPDAKIITWQEYNKITYSALILEKALIYLFLTLLFIILGVNLKNSISRLIKQKTSETGILRAIGLEKKQVFRIFFYQGIIVTVTGEIIGLITGLLFIHNISGIFSFADRISYLLTGSSINLTMLSYYAQIKPLENVIIVLFVFFLSIVFTFFGCRKLLKQEIMEEILNVSY